MQKNFHYPNTADNTELDIKKENVYSEFDVVLEYTRSQALADGVLVDVTEAAKRYGISINTAITRQVYEKFVCWSDDDIDKQIYQEEPARLDDILCMAALRARIAKKNNELNTSDTVVLYFQFCCIPRDGYSDEPIDIDMKMIFSIEEEPILTIMLPEED